jgi:hypothetical protein
VETADRVDDVGIELPVPPGDDLGDRQVVRARATVRTVVREAVERVGHGDDPTL